MKKSTYLKKISDIRKSAINKVAEPLSYLVTNRAKSERESEFANKVTEDIKVLREVKKGDKKSNSKTSIVHDRNTLSDPDSLARRKMRVEDFKRNMEKKYPKTGLSIKKSTKSVRKKK